MWEGLGWEPTCRRWRRSRRVTCRPSTAPPRLSPPAPRAGPAVGCSDPGSQGPAGGGGARVPAAPASQQQQQQQQQPVGILSPALPAGLPARRVESRAVFSRSRRREVRRGSGGRAPRGGREAGTAGRGRTSGSPSNGEPLPLPEGPRSCRPCPASSTLAGPKLGPSPALLQGVVGDLDPQVGTRLTCCPTLCQMGWILLCFGHLVFISYKTLVTWKPPMHFWRHYIYLYIC